MGERQVVMSPKEVAEYLQISEEEAIAELETGRMRGFRVGGHWRTTEQFVQDMINPVGEVREAPTIHADVKILQTEEMKGVPTLEELSKMTWSKVDGFEHNWPETKNATVPNIEKFEYGYEVTIRINNEDVSFVIGFCNRTAAGMNDRRRAVIFKGRIGQALYPLVEFAGANDFESTGRMVSIIRKHGRVPVKPGDTLPDQYQGMPTAIYNKIVVGKYAWNCIAVVAQKTDFHVMVRHAALRMFEH